MRLSFAQSAAACWSPPPYPLVSSPLSNSRIAIASDCFSHLPCSCPFLFTIWGHDHLSTRGSPDSGLGKRICSISTICSSCSFGILSSAGQVRSHQKQLFPLSSCRFNSWPASLFFPGLHKPCFAQFRSTYWMGPRIATHRIWNPSRFLRATLFGPRTLHFTTPTYLPHTA